MGSFEPNAFGLYDVLGNAEEWTQDCSNYNYSGAPTDGSAWQSGSCSRRIVRGGSFWDPPEEVRSAFRYASDAGSSFGSFGFRVARTMN